MRTQFNLLPDVKQNYINAERTRRTVTAIAVLVTGACVAIFLVMLSVVYGVNRAQLSSADANVKKYQGQLSSISNLGNILTVQNQLHSLLTLHQNKHITSRLFTFLKQLTPSNVKLGSVQLDLTTNTIQISGTADSQKTVNTFIDTLKFTTLKIDGKDSGRKAFPSVIESSFGLSRTIATYSLSVQFDPSLFANSGNATLNVPAGLSTTRSVLEDPANVLFNGQTNTKGQ